MKKPKSGRCKKCKKRVIFIYDEDTKKYYCQECGEEK
jgi:hypothetical protein